MGDAERAKGPRRRWGWTLWAACALASGVSGGGCATTGQDQGLRAEMSALQARVDELEQTNRRLHARLNQHDHTLQLVDDQLRSQRLAVAAPPPSGPRHTTIHLTPPGGYQAQGYAQPDPYGRDAYVPNQYAQDPYDEAPYQDPYPDPDRGGAGDGAGAEAASSAGGADEYEEIVVTDERVRAFIGEHGGSVGGDVPASSGGTIVRVPKAPVVHGDRLEVMPIDRQGKVVSGSPPAPQAADNPPPPPPTDPSLDAPPAPTPSASQPASGDPVQPYRDGLDAYRRADYAEAVRHFERFLNGNPPHDYVDNALYWLGDAYYGMGNYTQAAAYFHRVVKEHPTENKVPDALLKVGLTYQRLGREPSARDVFQYLIDTYPRSEAARLARDKLSTAADAPAL